jgi:hypothetical protein
LDGQSKKYYDHITENEEENTGASPRRRRNDRVKHSGLYVSTTDSEARVSRKQGKLPALNHLGIISVDTEHHVICGAAADFAGKKDSDTTEKIVSRTVENLR